MTNTIRIKRGLNSNRTSLTPVSGELIYTTDTKKVYIGDGTTAGGVQVGGDATAVGTIQYYPTNMTLDGTWLQANASIVSQSTYPALYTQVGLRLNSLTGTWTTRGVVTSDNLNAVEKRGFAVGNGVVACATTGGVYTSVFGLGWTLRLNANQQAIIYANNTFVSCGNGIYYSTDNGLNWNTASTTAWFYGITYGAGLFVAVGDNGKIWSSPDGITWTTRTSGIATTLNGVRFANGLFVAVGASGVVLTSPDAITWTSRTSGSGATLFSVAYGASTWVFVGSGGTVSTSPDAITWTSRTSGTAQNLFDVEFINNEFIAVGGQFTVYKSSNGTSWTGTFLDSSGTGYSVGYYNGMYLIGGFRTNQPGFFTSLDASVSSGLGYISASAAPFQNVAFGNNIYAIVTNQGHVFSSPDMVNITCRYTRTNYSLQRVVYANNLFLVVGGQASALTSPDGITWTFRNTGTTTPMWYGAAYGNSIYLVVGENSYSSRSSDAINWTYTGTSVFVGDFYDLVFAAGLFVAVGSTGQIYTTTDGISWTSRHTAANTLRSVIFANGQFVTVGTGGAISTSPNGTTWTNRTSGTTQDLRTVWYSSQTGRYFAAGANGTLIMSTDAITWSTVSSGTTGSLGGSVSSTGAYFLVGGSPTISTGSYYTYNPSTEFALPQGNATGTEGVKAMIKATL